MVAANQGRLRPGVDVAPWVSEIRVLALPACPPVMRLPAGSASLVVCAGDRGEPVIVAAGPITRGFARQPAALPLYIRVTLAPGATLPLFGVAERELADRVVALDELWAGDAVALRVGITRARDDVAATVGAVESAIAGRLRTGGVETAASRLAAAAARALAAPSAPGVDSLARRLGVSARRLRRVFAEAVGLPPKTYARIARIRRAAARAGTARWADIAADTGFYDQAHLTAEFRELIGMTPRAFAAARASTLVM